MQKKKKGRQIDGIVVVDKPTGLSSNQLLQKVKHLFNAQKAGHTGSLDPLATGVLPICLGEASKFSQYLLNADKVYLARLHLGKTTTTADAEGEVLLERPVDVSLTEIEGVLARFRGEQMQVPSMFSAIKHQGQPLYKLARQGIQIEREARKIHIYALDLLTVDYDDADKKRITGFEVKVHCSKGTYIRNLAEDIGEALGCGAYLAGLRRIQSGHLSVMLSMQQLMDLANDSEKALDSCVLPIEQALVGIPEFSLVDESAVLGLKQGKAITVDLVSIENGALLRLFDDSSGDHRFFGLGICDEFGMLRPQRLLKTN